ncbi:MAG: hypothetical protein ACTSSO_06410 [Candidatus Hodarchaeales archaeon]
MRINHNFRLISLVGFILTIMIISDNVIIQASESEYDGLEFSVIDQLIVDDQVMVKVNIHHPGFIVIYNQTGGNPGTMLGHSYSILMIIPHNHTQFPLKAKIQEIVDGEDHTAYVRIKLTPSGRTDTLYARAFNDTNMNMAFDMDGTDEILRDSSGKEVFESFTITGDSDTTIEAYNQTLSLTVTRVFVDKVIVPGPAWVVIHLNNNGALGPMLGRRFVPLEQGINSDLYIDITANLDLLNGSKQVAVFVHLHWDNSEYGLFNSTVDTHLYSPAFDDPIIGNESAVPITLTFEEESSVPGMNYYLTGLILVFLAILVSRKKK